MTKGGGWEWKSARGLSAWLTGGETHHLVRSQTSGAWVTSRTRAGKKVGATHAGDIAPEGPDAHPNVLLFCSSFYIECKAYRNQPNWWSLLRGPKPKVLEWWRVAQEQAQEHGDREPLLILKRNNYPPVVGHNLGLTFFPGPAIQARRDGELISFHLLEEVLKSDPREVLVGDYIFE